MDYMKKWQNVRTMSDLQNLVSGTLFRQTGEFTIEDLIKEINSNLRGSIFFEKKQVTLVCAYTIDNYLAIGALQPKERGKYLLAMPSPK